MQEVFAALPAGAWVLDLGSGAGSFSGEWKTVKVVGVVLEAHAAGERSFVQAEHRQAAISRGVV